MAGNVGMASEHLVLNSWKEIASYLGKGVRTVQRWELELGLPVQRPNQGERAIVCASREDLDKWRASVWGVRHKGEVFGADELTALREKIAELQVENASLKCELMALRSQQGTQFHASETSGLSDIFLRMLHDVDELRDPKSRR